MVPIIIRDNKSFFGSKWRKERERDINQNEQEGMNEIYENI